MGDQRGELSSSPRAAEVSPKIPLPCSHPAAPAGRAPFAAEPELNELSSDLEWKNLQWIHSIQGGDELAVKSSLRRELGFEAASADSQPGG